MRIIFSGGMILFCLFSAVVVMAESYHEIPLQMEIRDPVQVLILGVKGEELKNVQLALTLQAGLVHEGKVDRLWWEHFKNRIPEKVRKALTPFGYYQVKKRFPLRGLKKEFTNIPFPNDWRLKPPQEPRPEPHGFIALNSDDL